MIRGRKVCVRFAVACAAAAFVFSASPAAAQNMKGSLWKGLEWRLIGPFRGGRALAVEGVRGQPDVYYFGGVAGGVWKTVNGGLTWTPLFDKEAVSSIGSIAIAPSDPNVIYVGTGEACIRGNISFGDGVYKSTDAGKTWANVGLKDTRHIAKVLVDPRDPDVVLVAALGHAWGPNPERGIFRSTDGGKTWQKVLYKDEKTGAIDLAFDPQNSHIVFAALWEANRTPWSLTSGGPGSGLYKSTDGGATWKQITGHGLPEGVLGRIGVSISGGDDNRVYAIIEAEKDKSGIYLSGDSGKSWRLVNGDHRFTQRAWYFSHIFADPKSVDTLYVLNTGLYRSTDAGKNFQLVRAPHGDHHALWIDPQNPDRMINGNDGGATITTDGGKSWTSQDNQPTAQFYHVATDNRFPYYVYGAQQDNSTVAIASRSDNGAIDESDWYAVGGGESGYVVPDPADPKVVYAGSYDGLITRFDKRTGQRQDVSSWPENPMGSGAADLKHRFQWTAPIAISPHDPKVLYHGGEAVFKTTDGGMTWTAISPDLTRNDKSKQKSSGGPITQDNTSVEYYDTVFSIAESPVQAGVIWAGTDDGLVQLTRDAGRHWSNVTPKDLPEWGTVSIIDPSPYEAGAAYVAVDCHRLDNFHPYIFKTADFGKTWTKITTGLPDSSYVHTVRADPERKDLLYAGTETGVWVSFDDGANWQTLQQNLPTAPVHDLTVHGDDLVAATHGRSFWILDDITPLRQAKPDLADAAVHFYKPAVAYRFRGGAFRIPSGIPVGANPPSGVILDYVLKQKPDDSISLEILDSKGKTVRKFTSEKPKTEEAPSEFEAFFGGGQQHVPVKPGMSRFVWDLRYDPPHRVPGAVTWGGRPIGPLAAPGSYQARLTVAGKTYTVPIDLKADPRVHTSQADFEKQLDLALKIRDRVTQASDAVNHIRSLHAELTALRKRLGGDEKYKKLAASATELDKKLSAVEEDILQVKSKSNEDPLNYPIKLMGKLLALASTVESADAAPTQASYTVLNDLDQKLGVQLVRWREIQNKDLAEFNRAVEKEKIPAFSAVEEERSK